MPMPATTISTLIPADRDRLVKLLGMLGSDHSGERDAAALAVVRLLRQRKLAWSDVIAAAGPAPNATRAVAETNWRQTVAACLRQPGALDPWEAGFLHNLSRSPRISPKQAAVLRQIALRLGVSSDGAA